MESVKLPSNGRQFSGGNSSSRAVCEPTPIPIEVGNEFLGPFTKDEQGHELNSHFRNEQSGVKCDCMAFGNVKTNFTDASHADR
jgi:hypothetical protein